MLRAWRSRDIFGRSACVPPPRRPRGRAQVALRLRGAQIATATQLWRRACAPVGDTETRGGLPARCDRAWFARTFCGGAALDEVGASDAIWPHVQSLAMTAPLALLAAVPACLTRFFRVRSRVLRRRRSRATSACVDGDDATCRRRRVAAIVEADGPTIAPAARAHPRACGAAAARRTVPFSSFFAGGSLTSPTRARLVFVPGFARGVQPFTKIVDGVEHIVVGAAPGAGSSGGGVPSDCIRDSVALRTFLLDAFKYALSASSKREANASPGGGGRAS